MKGSGPPQGEGAGGKKLTCEWSPPPPSWVVLSTIQNVLSKKQKFKIDCNFQFSNFRLPPKTEKLSHATDCNIVGEAKLPLSLIFLLIVDRIKVKICVMFQYSTKRKKSQVFSIWHFRIFSDDKILKNQKLTSIFNF